MKTERKINKSKKVRKDGSFRVLVVGLVCLNYLVLAHGKSFVPNTSLFVHAQSADPFSRQTHTPPIYLTIPSLSLIMPVRSAAVVGNNWDLYTDAVSWLNTSSTPDEKGNVIIYGHNTMPIFGKISQLSAGDEIYIKTRYEMKKYVVYAKDEVEPDNLSYVQESSNRLTIYTCSGPWDSKRLFILAQPEESKTNATS